jgi:hypothetical protein
MASAPVRDQLGDHPITPRNAALVVIDYQPSPCTPPVGADRLELGEGRDGGNSQGCRGRGHRRARGDVAGRSKGG